MPNNPLKRMFTGGGYSRGILAVLLCALVVLAGCGNGATTDSDDEGHRFATERRPTSVPTEQTESTPEEAIVEAMAQPTSPPEMTLSFRGAPQFVYLMMNDGLQVYDTAARTFTPVKLEDGFILLDYTSSPTGDRVGVLGTAADTVVVQFFGADGEPLGDAASLPANITLQASSPVASPVASPVSTRTADQITVSWIPQGNAVVVSGPGVLMRVSMDGTTMPISRSGVSGAVVEALWSPMDSQVAILTDMSGGHQGVFMLKSGHADADELDQLHLQPEQNLSNLQWLPNGLGLVLVAGNDNNGDLMNGQLYVYRFDEPVPSLVATSGQGGPAGTITNAVVSPDGNSVAYAVMVRDSDDWHLHSLWVRPLKGGPGLSIPLASNEPITDIVWTAEGLVWQQADGSITVIDTTLQPRPLGEEPQATPVASPESTPVIEATPRG